MEDRELMKQEEIRKCTKVVELFRSMMDELGDICALIPDGVAEKSAESVCESAADCAASLANRTVWSRYLRVRGTSASYVGVGTRRREERTADMPPC